MSQNHPYGRDRLPYPYSYTTRSEYPADGYPTTQVDTQPNTDDDIYILLQLTNDQLLRLSSALTAGADLIYPDDQVNVLLPFLEARKMTLCDAISECFDQTDFQDAISSYGYIRQLTPNTIINNSQYSNQTIITPEADDNPCDDDSQWGRVEALVNQVDASMLDFYQNVDASANVAEQVGNIIEAIPVVGLLPFDDVVQILSNSGEQWRDSYEASVNASLLEQAKCDLWCLTRGQCDLSTSTFREYLLEKYNLNDTIGQLNALSLFTLLSRIASVVLKGGGLTYIGDDMVWISWLLQLSALELTDNFLGFSIIDYAEVVAAGNPNSGHSVCSSCATTSLNIDFSATSDPFTIDSGSLSSSFGNPPPCANIGNTSCGQDIFAGDLRLTINSDQSTDIALSRVEFDLWYECQISGTQRPRWRVILYDASNNVLEDSGFQFPNVTNTQRWSRIVWNANTTYTNVRRVRVQAAKFTTSTFSRRRQYYAIDNIQAF